MKKEFKLIISLLFIFIGFANQMQAQYATKKVKSKHHAYTDSLKSVEYNYTFPIWGQAAYNKGFDIPYPIGIMGNFIWMNQGITIDNMQLGFKGVNTNVPMTDVDFINFGENVNTSYAYNIRPDIWIFPFLDLYGIFGGGRSKTEVNLVAPIDLKSVVDQKITTAGVGVMTAFGIGPVWVSADANWTWNKPELLDKAVLVNILGIRLGHTFVFKSRPDRNIALWVGGMRTQMSSETNGAISMASVFPDETWDRGEQIGQQYDDWYDDLGPIMKAKVDESALPEIVDGIRNNDRNGSSTIYYGMDKQVLQLWNGVVGMQFQINKHWQLRTEAGIIGDRKSLLLSLNYRFLGL